MTSSYVLLSAFVASLARACAHLSGWTRPHIRLQGFLKAAGSVPIGTCSISHSFRCAEYSAALAEARRIRPIASSGLPGGPVGGGGVAAGPLPGGGRGGGGGGRGGGGGGGGA